MLSRFRFVKPVRTVGALSVSAALRFLTITPIAMPALSPSMETGKITEWLTAVGAPISQGDSFCKVETDKSVMRFDNMSEDGFLARQLVPAGAEGIKIGTVIALVVDEESAVNSDAVKNWKPSSGEGAPAATEEKPVEEATPAAPTPSASTPAAAASSSSGSRKFASPLAKATAKERGIDINNVQGTGGSVGRVTQADVLAAKPGTAAPAASGKTSQPAPTSAPLAVSTPAAQPKQAAAPAPAAATSAPARAEFEEIPVSGMRDVIAKRLTQSTNGAPHYYETMTCRADNMLQTIKHLNEKGKGTFKISVNDYLIKAIARANVLVPAANTHWAGNVMRRYYAVDVSVAVATPAGLITPIVRDAQAKGLVEISNEVKALAKKAREGTLQPQEFQGGTVSISNLGGMGMDSFTAILNPPQSLILAVGRVQPRAEITQDEDGEFQATGKIEKALTVTASWDHRVVDGAVGAEWFKHFKDAVENPLSLLL